MARDAWLYNATRDWALNFACWPVASWRDADELVATMFGEWCATSGDDEDEDRAYVLDKGNDRAFDYWAETHRDRIQAAVNAENASADLLAGFNV